jgi:hypothetical protein
MLDVGRFTPPIAGEASRDESLWHMALDFYGYGCPKNSELPGIVLDVVLEKRYNTTRVECPISG